MPDTPQQKLVKKDLPKLPRPRFAMSPAERRGHDRRAAAIQRGVEGRAPAIKRGEEIRKKARKKK